MPWSGGGPGTAAIARAQSGGGIAPRTSGRLPCTSAGARSGTDDGTPHSGPVPGERMLADTPSTAPRRVTARPQESHRGGGDGGAASAPRYAAPRETRSLPPDGGDRGPQSAESRPPPARGDCTSPAGFGARVG